MELIDDKTYAIMQKRMKSADGTITMNDYMKKSAMDFAKRMNKDKPNENKTNEEEMAELWQRSMDPYQNYAIEFYDEDLRKEVRKTREFLPRSFNQPICIQDQNVRNDIVHNIRLAFSINNKMAKLHAKNNVSIQNYINGIERLCKQTVITLIASFDGIKNFIDGVNKGIHTYKNYDHDQYRLTIVVLKHFFAYPNILKKIVTTHSVFKSLCRLWMQTVKYTTKLFNLRNKGASFPLLLKNDKYEMELFLLELSCLFLRTSYCWLTPKCNKYIIKTMKQNKLFESMCQWLSARTSKWDYDRIVMMTALSIKNRDNEYQQICHQTNYVFQCLITSIQTTQLRMINGVKLSLTQQEYEKVLKTSKYFAYVMVKNNIGGAWMQACMAKVKVRTPLSDVKILELFPGIDVKQLKKTMKQWKYKLLECQSSKCNVKFGKKNIKLQKCSGCKITFYCSRYCQKYDWKCKHRFECNKIA